MPIPMQPFVPLQPTTQLDIPGAFQAGLQMQGARQQNQIRAMALEDAQRERQAAMTQEKARAIVQKYAGQAFELQRKYLALESEHGPEQASKLMQPIWNPIRDAARSDGLDASDSYDSGQMAQFMDTATRLGLWKEQVELTKAKTEKPKSKYTPGELVNDIIIDGKKYQATFAGIGESGLPIWKNRQEMPEKKAGESSPEDRIHIRELSKDLPKLKDDAIKQNRNISTIDSALNLLKTGTVTGKMGQFKAFIQPYAEAMGVDTKSMSDAQTFQLLTRTITGPMRLDIVGPGAVTEYEQQLIKQMSGGGGTGQAAALELLNYYKQVAKDKVLNYNSTLEGAISIDPTFSKYHKKINITPSGIKAESPATPARIPSTPSMNRKRGTDGNWYIRDENGWKLDANQGE